LELVVDVVSRPVADAERPRTYAMGQMLLPKVQAYLPERAGALQGALNLPTIGLPQQVTDPASYARLSQSRDQSDDEGLRYIEGLSDDGQKDALYTNHVRGHILAGEKRGHAREVAGRVKDPDRRRPLLAYLDFTEAVSLLEEKRTSEALDLAERMPAGIERCLPRLSGASAIAESDPDPKAAFPLVMAALEDARQVDDDHQPYLILSAAIVLLPMSEPSARQVFFQAVSAFNGQPAPDPATPEPRTYNPQAQRGPRPKPDRKPRTMPRGSSYFMTLLDATEPGTSVPLKVPGVKAYDFEAAILSLFASDPRGVEAMVRTLASEELLYRTLPSLAKAWLSTLPPPRPLIESKH
jgi:hypothetical protein